MKTMNTIYENKKNRVKKIISSTQIILNVFIYIIILFLTNPKNLLKKGEL